MLSLRSIVRSLPRVVSRNSAQTSTRPLSYLSKYSRLQQAWRIAARPSYASFSSLSARYQASEGQVDQELSAKFESELQLEKETNDSDHELPPNLKDFLDSSPFQIHDIPGEEEVVLTRSFGNEKIRITFNIADLNTFEDDDQYSSDQALYDEDSRMQSGGAQSKQTINQGRTQDGNFNVAPEDSVAPADRQELADDESPEVDEDPEPSFPVRVNVTIEKAGVPGAIEVDTTAQDGMIVIENVYYFPKAEFAVTRTAEQDWARRLRYTGPPYGNLDQDLQVLLERYLDERGINTALALWVPEYIDYKEQREYMNWLSGMKSFVDA